MKIKKEEIVIKEFVLDKDKNPLLAISKTGISPLAFMVHPITMTRFEGEKETYVSLNELKNWFIDEKKDGSKEDLKILKILEGNIEFCNIYLEKFKNGEIKIKNDKTNEKKDM